MDSHGSVFSRDRRIAQRHNIKTALRVRVWRSGLPEERAESVPFVASLRNKYGSSKQVHTSRSQGKDFTNPELSHNCQKNDGPGGFSASNNESADLTIDMSKPSRAKP